MKTKSTAMSLGVVLLVAGGVAGYASCGSSGGGTPSDGGAGSDGGGGSGGTAGTDGGAADGGGNCGGSFAPNDAGVDAVSLHAAVQAILDTHCITCHSAPDGGTATTLPQSLDLTNVAAVVGRISTECGPADGGADAGGDASTDAGDAGGTTVAVTGKKIIDSTHPGVSYMVDKVIGHAQDCGCFMGAHMPFMCDEPDAGRSCLGNDDIQVIVNWIQRGAP